VKGKIPIVKRTITIAIVFVAVLILATPDTAYGGSHNNASDVQEDEHTITLQLIDSVTQETIIGDIRVADRSIQNESSASFNVSEGMVKVFATAEGYSSFSDTIDVRRSGMLLSARLEPKKQQLEVTTVGSEGEPLKVDYITTSPEKVELSSTSRNTSVHTVKEAYQGYTYTVEAVSNGTVVASEEVEIQDKETELEIVVTNQAEIPIIGVDVKSALFVAVSFFFILGIVGLIVLYRRRTQQSSQTDAQDTKARIVYF
jgi:hypothetical protein